MGVSSKWIGVYETLKVPGIGQDMINNPTYTINWYMCGWWVLAHTYVGGCAALPIGTESVGNISVPSQSIASVGIWRISFIIW
jgi:hypothetical protein